MIRIVKDFFPKARSMRQFFDQQFAEPREAHEKRFVWDLWYIEDQYRLLRTPAYYYFDEVLYGEFQRHLQQWGRKNLGCSKISPPWLSVYVDGCFQNLHADNPHGPFAYVFSLTEWSKRSFTGGETLLLKQNLLDYWSHYTSSKGFELSDFRKKISPRFNQLTLFDPRIPHGVDRVQGALCPTQGRVVIHGWFTEPEPQVSGGLSLDEVNHVLQQELPDILATLPVGKVLQGALVYQIKVRSGGRVSEVKILSNGLRDLSEGGSIQKISGNNIKKHLSKLNFAKKASSSEIILPLVFDDTGED